MHLKYKWPTKYKGTVMKYPQDWGTGKIASRCGIVTSSSLLFRGVRSILWDGYISFLGDVLVGSLARQNHAMTR